MKSERVQIGECQADKDKEVITISYEFLNDILKAHEEVGIKFNLTDCELVHTGGCLWDGFEDFTFAHKKKTETEQSKDDDEGEADAEAEIQTEDASQKNYKIKPVRDVTEFWIPLWSWTDSLGQIQECNMLRYIENSGWLGTIGFLCEDELREWLRFATQIFRGNWRIGPGTLKFSRKLAMNVGVGSIYLYDVKPDFTVHELHEHTGFMWMSEDDTSLEMRQSIAKFEKQMQDQGIMLGRNRQCMINRESDAKAEKTEAEPEVQTEGKLLTGRVDKQGGGGDNYKY